MLSDDLFFVFVIFFQISQFKSLYSCWQCITFSMEFPPFYCQIKFVATSFRFDLYFNRKILYFTPQNVKCTFGVKNPPFDIWTLTSMLQWIYSNQIIKSRLCWTVPLCRLYFSSFSILHKFLPPDAIVRKLNHENEIRVGNSVPVRCSKRIR